MTATETATETATPRTERVRQLVQSVKSGELRLVEVPVPEIGSTEVLVRTEHSIISAGTERAVRKLASASLLSKAKARPDLVRKVVQKARTDGLSNALSTVRTRLSDEMPLGYSAAGTVLAVGDAVPDIRPGMRVATGGVGHGEMQVVPGLLCAPIPEGVSSGDAAFATITSIALHGIRRAEVEPGGEIVILGLGLIGQIGLRLAAALGYRAVGMDVSEWAVEQARKAGFDAYVDKGQQTTGIVQRWSRLGGADAVVIMASTPSSEPVRRSVDLVRDRGTIVVVGDIGLELERTPLYEKELTIKLARSYGPGRYERSYEDWAVDFPPAYVRWTEGRNLSAVLDMLASGRLELGSLVTHHFAFDDVAEAYEVVEGQSEPMLGVRLDYRAAPVSLSVQRPKVTTNGSWPAERGDGVAFIGAGKFARGVLLPAMREAGFTNFVSVASASGVSAERLAADAHFKLGATTVENILADPSVGTVVIATPHDRHAELVAQSLACGLNVFCEKPLALTIEELRRVDDAWRASTRSLMVGYNRRYSPAMGALKDRFADAGPSHITYRINAGPLDPKHWYADRRQGGRLLGEVCHFVDTCLALMDVPLQDLSVTSSVHDEPLLSADFAVTLRTGGGSIASIAYASQGNVSTPKERLEVLCGGHTGLIDDFRSASVDGRIVWSGRQNKGHAAQFSRFREALMGGASMRSITEATLASSRAVIAAAEQLITAAPRELQ